MKRAVISALIAGILITGITTFTSLTFEYSWLRNGIYLLTTVFLVAATGYITSNNVRLLTRLFIVGLTVSIVLILGSETRGINGTWKTTSIYYRKDNSNMYIAQQMLDIGARGYARRVVLVEPVTPIFSRIMSIDTTKLVGDWRRVNEDRNPFDWK